MGQNVNGYRGEKMMAVFADSASFYIMCHTLMGLNASATPQATLWNSTDDIIEAYQSIDKLVSHLHLPIQSGSNQVLAAMKRNHTVDVYMNQIAKLRKIRPDLHLSSDFIIGFPGETDEDFYRRFNLQKT